MRKQTLVADLIRPAGISSFRRVLQSFLAFILVHCLWTSQVSAQYIVTGLHTDYQGYWRSDTAVKNPVKPMNSHSVIAFTWNGTTFSTGVSDSTLTARGVTFTPRDFRAFPIDTIPTTGTPLIGLGQLYDGVNNGGSNPAPFPAPATKAVLASFLTDGKKGLDIGTGVANVAAGRLQFNLSSLGISASAISDGVPDVLITQIASPGGALDSIYFINVSGAVVGNKISINHEQIDALGNWTPDFYNISGAINITNSDRTIRCWAADLNDFGINAGNVSSAVALIYRLNGSSDPAFVAFNVPSISVATQLSVITPFSPTVNSNCCGGAGINLSQQSPVVQVQDGSGNNILQAGLSVTASIVSGPAGYGALGGTVTAVTNAQGQATFTNLRFPCEEGNYVIRFSSSNLDPATSAPVTVGTRNYYVRPSSANNLSALSSWSSTMDGSGTTPDDFGPGQVFNITSTDGTNEFYSGAAWTVTGRIVIPVGRTLNISPNTSTTLSCDVSQSGNILGGGSSTLILNGSGAQRLDGLSNLHHLTINNAAGVTLNGNTVVNNNTVLSSGVLRVVNTNLTLNGTLTRSSGTINASAAGSVVTLNGSSALTISSGIFGSGIYDLTVNNPAGISLGSNINVLNRVTLTNGLIRTGAYNLTALTVSGGNAGSYIQTAGAGAVITTIAGSGAQLLIPVGRSAYNPVLIRNNNVTADQFSIRVLDEVYQNSTSGQAMAEPRIRRTWNISKSGANNGGLDFEFNWNAGENSGLSIAALYDYSSGWIKQTNGTSNNISSTRFGYQGYTGSSTAFALIDNAITLPVVWASFTAMKTNTSVRLEWKTSSEQDTRDFEVQRSTDGQAWTTIATVAAAGNSSIIRTYSSTDQHPSAGINYYRIRQYDIDGHSSYSSIRSVNMAGNAGSSLEVLGNPVTGKQLRLHLARTMEVELHSADGKMLWRKTLASGTHIIAADQLQSGVYFLHTKEGNTQVIVRN